MASTQLALIYTFVASILASNIPIMDAGNNRVGVNEAFGRFSNLDNLHRFGTGWPGLNDRSALTRRQNVAEHVTITETDTETIHEIEEVPERVLVEEHHPEVVVVEDRPTGVLSDAFELRLEEELLLAEELKRNAVLADDFDLAARRARGGRVLGEDVILPIEPIRHLRGEEENVIINRHNTVNNFTPNGISITGVGPNGNGLGDGVKGPITITNLSVN